MVYKLIICIFSLTLLGYPAPLLARDSYQSIRSDYQALSTTPQLQRQRNNWEKIIKRFDQYVRENPGAPEVEKALYLKARTWDGLSLASGSLEDAREAINHYLAFSDRFSSSFLADDALYNAAQIAELRLNDPSTAARYHQWLVDQYPQGDMVKSSSKRLAVLPEPMSQPRDVKAAEAAENRGSAPALERIRFHTGPKYTRVVLDLTAPVAPEPHLLKGENPRIYFDLLYTEIAPQLDTDIPILNGLVKRVRTSRFDEQRTRVVIDLNRQSDYRMVTLDNPFRVVVDVQGQPQSPDATARQPVLRSLPAAGDDSIAGILTQNPDRPTPLHVPQSGKQDGIKLIVIDAGHGGRDPGAIGPNRIMEKQVTLEMAKRLAERLRKELGVKVLLTRSDDRFIELRERTAYANRVGADLFISMHANASPNNRAYGLETYFLNLAKNDQAAEVAARENGTSLEEVSNLEAILFDLMANAKINESSRLAAEVQQALVAGLRPHYSRIKDLGVRQGPFHVLLGATMPSVLVEAAFISNHREEKRLRTRQYQDRVAAAIVSGVKKYANTVDQVARR